VSWLWDVSLLTGVVPALVSILGVAALAFLLAQRRREWWRRVVPICIAGSVLLVTFANAGLEWWGPFPDPLSLRVLLWATTAVLAVTLGVVRIRSHHRPRSALRGCSAVAVAALLVVTLAAMKINSNFGYRPTVGAALGVTPANEVDFAALVGPKPTVVTSPNQALSQSWHPPADMPPTGRVTHTTIGGVRSGFRARAALVYVPPAYLGSRRPLLPVLVLIAGQPGGPEDWLVAGKMAKIMDAFAAAHAGLAPIVVVPDATGAPFANTLCLDSRLARVETYLAEDVPSWIESTLQVDRDHAHWAIGGFSFGGTCSLQLAVRRPSTYPTFLDVSGQQEPTLGSHAKTVQAAFGGDETQFRAANPLDILHIRRFGPTLGILATGADDPEYGPQCRRVADAAGAAGMAIQLLEFPGGHSWTIASDALRAAIPRLAARANLIPPR